MEITTRWHNSVAILDLVGPMTAGADTKPLHNRIGCLIQGETHGIVLNLAGVTRLDASGIGQLVMLHEKLESAHGNLQLMNVDRRQRRLLELVRLLDVFDPVDSEEEALERFRTSSRASSRADRAHRRGRLRRHHSLAVC